MKVKSFYICLFVFLFTDSTTAWNLASRSSGAQLQEDFSLKQYAGRWYEMYRTENIPWESGTDIQANYVLNSDHSSFKVQNKSWKPDKNNWKEGEASLEVDSWSNPAAMLIKFSRFMPAADYSVLYTDYENIAVVASSNAALFGWFRKKYGWILARSTDVSEAHLNRAFDIVSKRYGLSRSDFIKTPHGVAKTEN